VTDAGRRLFGFGAEAQESRIGIILTTVSLIVMPFLGWANLRTSGELGESRAPGRRLRDNRLLVALADNPRGPHAQSRVRMVVGRPAGRACHRPVRRPRRTGESARRVSRVKLLLMMLLSVIDDLMSFAREHA
jgi:hypothetical protein